MAAVVVAPFILILLFWTILSDGLTLPELLTSPPEQIYFRKYEPCSISTSRLHDAYFVEGKLAEKIIRGLTNLKMKSYERDYSEKDNELERDMKYIMEKREKEDASNNFTNNPINALYFLTRIVTIFNPILNSIFTSEILMRRVFYKDLSAVVDRCIREESSCWPSPDDIHFIVKSFSRISSTYNLPKNDLSKGYICNQSSFESLSLDQSIVLSQEAHRNGYFEDVLEWAQFLLAGINISTNENVLKYQGLLRTKAAALFKKNELDKAISTLEEAIKEARFDTKSLKRDLNFYISKREQEVTHVDHITDKNLNFSDLCRNKSPLNYESGLHCYYRQIGIHWYRVKVEMITRYPPTFKYYEIINQVEILHLFDLMKTLKIKMSAYNEKGSIITDTKLSREMAVIWDDEHEITRQLSQRITYITGLEVKTYKYNTKISSSSPFQIINYGIGGYVEPHTDYLAKNENDRKRDISVFGGDRMATWMYHLSDQVHGGQLVFTKSNIHVSLEKGSGILIYNIFKNGTINPSAEYMECPVIIGSKWIGTKYIHENGNMFKRKCHRRKQQFF